MIQNLYDLDEWTNRDGFLVKKNLENHNKWPYFWRVFSHEIPLCGGSGGAPAYGGGSLHQMMSILGSARPLEGVTT